MACRLCIFYRPEAAELLAAHDPQGGGSIGKKGYRRYSARLVEHQVKEIFHVLISQFNSEPCSSPRSASGSRSLHDEGPDPCHSLGRALGPLRARVRVGCRYQAGPEARSGLASPDAEIVF